MAASLSNGVTAMGCQLPKLTQNWSNVMSKKTEQTSEKPKRKKVLKRQNVANKLIAELKGRSSLSELATKVDAAVVASGGETNLHGSMFHVRRSLITAEALGVVELTRPTDLFVSKK